MIKNFLENTVRNRNFRGFTLIEVLVALSIFATLGMLAMTVFVNVTRTQARVALDYALNEDSKFVVQKLRQEIEANAIDYEEYFNKVITSDASLKPNEYGKLQGCYATQFFNPGVTGSGNPDVLGNLCGGADQDSKPEDKPNCTIFKPSIDINTGMNPYEGKATVVNTDASAFCANNIVSATSLRQCTGAGLNALEELYLISADGQNKTIFARRKVREVNVVSEYGIGVLKLTGQDENGNGVFEKFTGCDADGFCCADGFDCQLNGTDKLEDTLTKYFDNESELNKGFVSILPLKSNITKLAVFILPEEGPNKEF